MTTTPGTPEPDEQGSADEQSSDVESANPEGAGAEIGLTEGEGSTFEPEEDAEAEGDR